MKKGGRKPPCLLGSNEVEEIENATKPPEEPEGTHHRDNGNAPLRNSVVIDSMGEQ